MDIFKTSTSLTAVSLPVTTTLYSTEFDTTGLQAKSKKGKEKIGGLFKSGKEKVTKDREFVYERVDADGKVTKSIKFKTGRTTSCLITTSTSTAIAGANKCTSERYLQKIENQSLNVCLDSLSDKELEEALQKFDLLEADNDSVNVKTNIK